MEGLHAVFEIAGTTVIAKHLDYFPRQNQWALYEVTPHGIQHLAVRVIEHHHDNGDPYYSAWCDFLNPLNWGDCGRAIRLEAEGASVKGVAATMLLKLKQTTAETIGSMYFEDVVAQLKTEKVLMGKVAK